MSFPTQTHQQEFWNYADRKLTEDPFYLYSLSRGVYAETTLTAETEISSVTGKGILGMIGFFECLAGNNAHLTALEVDGIKDSWTVGSMSEFYLSDVSESGTTRFGAYIPFKTSVKIYGYTTPAGVFDLVYSFFSFSKVAREKRRTERYDEQHDILIEDLYDENDVLLHRISSMRIRGRKPVSFEGGRDILKDMMLIVESLDKRIDALIGGRPT